MANTSRTTKTSALFVKPMLIGFALGALALIIAQVVFNSVFLDRSASHHELSTEGGGQNTPEKEPLYWVAPMDANYRRDQPGKSPMGMDLVPVFQESESSSTFEKGAVLIAPELINNLGVRTALAERKTINSDIVTVGYVKYDEDEIVHIHPRVEGWIEKLYVKAEGNEVDKGEPLYTLYSPQLVNAQEELIIALRRNNKDLVNAAKDRLKALQLSQDLIEQLETSRQVKQNITFYAPQSGVVDGLNIREGFFVKPENTLLSIAKLNKVWVETEVYERDVIYIAEGLPVRMTLGYLPGREWIGKVDYVYPSLDANTRTLRVRLAFDNTDNLLRPNMFANVTIYHDEGYIAQSSNRQSASTVAVPKEAVIRTGSQNRVVLALGEGKFKSINVDIGRVSRDSIEILNGVHEGDRVVTSAQFLIDSESSKTSDFARMESNEMPKSAWMKGTINNVMKAHRMVNITHEPVDEWDWPAMTMDFMIAESVDVAELEAGQHLHFKVMEKDKAKFEIINIHINSHSHMSKSEMTEPDVSSATVTGVINTLNTSTRIVNISREAIEKWNRPPATMDFVVADNIDLTRFSVSDTVNFTFEIRDDFIVVDMAHKSAASSPNSHNHEEMNHEEMNHEEMNHEEMNHEEMNHD